MCLCGELVVIFILRPVSFQPSDVKQPRDADGHILLDDTDFTVTYAVS